MNNTIDGSIDLLQTFAFCKGTLVGALIFLAAYIIFKLVLGRKHDG